METICEGLHILVICSHSAYYCRATLNAGLH
jgi:hypothetical protein